MSSLVRGGLDLLGSPLKSRNFILIWLGQGLSSLGNQVSTIAWIWVLTDLTRETTQIGLVFAAYSMSSVLFVVIGGVAADRAGPRTVALWAEIANALLGFILAALVIRGWITLESFIVLAALFGIVMAFGGPALSALFPSIVESRDFNAANSLRQFSTQGAALLGPAFGGFLIAQWSTGIALAFDATTFALSAIAILLIRGLGARPVAKPGEGAARLPSTDELLGGIRFLASQRGMLTIIIIFALTNALNNVEAVLVPVLARSDLGLQAGAYGLLASCLGIGALFASTLMGLIGNRMQNSALAICGGLALLGAAIMLMGAASTVVMLYVAYAVFGFGFIVPEIVSVTLWQRMIPEELRGRVFGVLGVIAMVANPAGYVIAGVVGDSIGPRRGLLFAGALIVILASLAFLMPSVRALNRFGIDSMAEAAAKDSSVGPPRTAN